MELNVDLFPTNNSNENNKHALKFKIKVMSQERHHQNKKAIFIVTGIRMDGSLNNIQHGNIYPIYHISRLDTKDLSNFYYRTESLVYRGF